MQTEYKQAYKIAMAAGLDHLKRNHGDMAGAMRVFNMVMRAYGYYLTPTLQANT